MGKRRINIWIATGTLVLLWIFLCICQQKKDMPPVSVQVMSDTNMETIMLWEKEHGDFYCFLPAYTNLEQVKIRLHTENAVMLDGMELKNGMSCERFQTDVSYELMYTKWGQRKCNTVTFVHSANVAALYIDTESGRMNYIHEKKGNEESGMLRLYTENGKLDYAGNLESVKGRGNATWTNREKKPYSLTLTQSADLLGMGNSQKWILLANAFDSTNLRNKIVYDFAKKVGLAYSPDAQWVDLYLNGEYAGLYLLCERNEVHPERVAISENGSFLVSLELEERLIDQNYQHITTEASQALRIHYPHNASSEYLKDLEAQWQAVENAFLAEDGIDPVTGKSWHEQIDLDSWVRKYLIEEIFGSIDACLISQYFYKDGAEKKDIIFAGPVWDFDNSMGNGANWELNAPVSFLANQPHNKNGFFAPWFVNLYQKELFYSRLVELYQSDFLPALNRLINQEISDYTEYIQQAALMNEIRWFENSNGFWEEVNHVAAYMSARIDFFTKLWCEEVEYCLVKADHGLDCWYAVPFGETLTEIYEFEDNESAVFLGWYYSDTDEPFDITKPITEDVEVYAKWEPKPPNRLRQTAKIAPLMVIAFIGFWVLTVDIRRMRKNR